MYSGAICCSDHNAASTLVLHLNVVENLARPAEPPSPGMLERENFLSRPLPCVLVNCNKQHCLGQDCLHATDGREAGGASRRCIGSLYKPTPGGRCRFSSRSAQAEYPELSRHRTVKELNGFHSLFFAFRHKAD